MRIAAYITPKSFINPTGQAKHAINMVLCLARRPDVELTLLAAKDQLTDDGRIPEGSPLHAMPVCSIPLPARALHFLWRTFNWQPVDRWCGKVDWVYSPTEMYVPARNARIAATIHCVNWFENDLPWSSTAENLQARRRMAKVFRPIIRYADLICTVSEFLKGRICELFQVDANRVTVVGNGVERCFFGDGQDKAAPLPPPPEQSYLLAVAPPHLRKGFNYLIQLADELAKRKSGIKLKVAGASFPPNMTTDAVRRRWSEEVASLWEQSLARPNIELLGYEGSETLVHLMRQSVALLILSRYETFGIPALEAMAAGTPVIASRFAALPEVVGEAGILVDATQPAEILTALLSLHNVKTREQHRQLGFRRAQQFTWEACASRLLASMNRRSMNK
jgi:glycosyltransferase involved in cell wall biosynthesis